MKNPNPRSPLRRQLLAGLAGAALLPRIARAGDDFLVGRTLRILIASSIGSGNDSVGRIFARHAQRLLPETEVVVENHEGAGGRLAEKMLWQAEPDGLTICFMRASMTFRVLLDPAGHPYGFGDFTWLGCLSRDRRVLISRTGGGIDSIEALIARDAPSTAAVDNVNSVRFINATALNYLIGTRILPVPGYNGSEAFLSLVSGEVDVLLGTFETEKSLLDSGDAQGLLRLSDAPLPAPYDSLPSLTGLAIPDGKLWLLNLLQLEADLGRLVAAPPGLPPDRSERLRALMRSVVEDPKFVADMAVLGMALDPIIGEEIQARVVGAMSALGGGVGELQAVFDCGLQRAQSGTSC